MEIDRSKDERGPQPTQPMVEPGRPLLSTTRPRVTPYGVSIPEPMPEVNENKIHFKDGLVFESVLGGVAVTKYIDARCMFAPQFTVTIPSKIWDQIVAAVDKPDLLEARSITKQQEVVTVLGDMPDGGHPVAPVVEPAPKTPEEIAAARGEVDRLKGAIEAEKDPRRKDALEQEEKRLSEQLKKDEEVVAKSYEEDKKRLAKPTQLPAPDKDVKDRK